MRPTFWKKSIPFSFTQKVAKKEYKKIELLAVGYSKIIKHCYFLKIHNLYPDKTHNVVGVYSESVFTFLHHHWLWSSLRRMDCLQWHPSCVSSLHYIKVITVPHCTPVNTKLNFIKQLIMDFWTIKLKVPDDPNQ